MPTYDYRCDANGKTVEVFHGMSEHVDSWGELCNKAGIDPGKTALDAPVHRLATGGNVISINSLGSGTAPACSSGSCCPGGMCGLE